MLALGKSSLMAAPVIQLACDSLLDDETKAIFLFECTRGILLSIITGNSGNRTPNIEPIQAALRTKYEALYGVSLANAPSFDKNRPGITTRPAEAKMKVEAAEQKILRLLKEPLEKQVSQPAREAMSTLLQERTDFARQLAPHIQLESPAAFEESVASLRSWVAPTVLPAERISPNGSAPLAALTEARILAEEGQAIKALERAERVYPCLSKTRKQALAPFFVGLAWLLLAAIERLYAEGDAEAATSIVQKSRTLIAETPALGEFNGLVNELFLQKPPPDSVGDSPASAPTSPRRQQAQALLSDYADELSLAGNRPEREFLYAVIEGSDQKFKWKEKLNNRLRRLTQWGGREPYRTTAALLESVIDADGSSLSR